MSNWRNSTGRLNTECVKCGKPVPVGLPTCNSECWDLAKENKIKECTDFIPNGIGECVNCRLNARYHKNPKFPKISGQ